jgi:V8-like Glu-specific endopeptidase
MSGEHKSKHSPEEIRAYWTPERKASAKPEPFTPVRPSNPDPEPAAPPREQKDIEGYDPTPAGERSSSTASGQLTAEQVAHPTAYPWRTVGKLFYTKGTANYYASASAIHRNTLLTAAHVLYNGTAWAAQVTFVPALSGTTEPFGSWYYDDFAAMPGWRDTLQTRYDVGVIWLNLGGTNNEPIGQAVGYLGRTYNRTLPRNWVDAGYPAAERTMYSDEGRYMQSYSGGRVVSKSGSLGPGVSGGPWLNYGDLTYANGVHSGSLSNTEKESAYFNKEVSDFIENNLR